MRVVQRDDRSSSESRSMKATNLAAEVASNMSVSFSIGQPVRVCLGTLTGLSGTVTELPAPGRASIKLQPGVYLEADQSCLGPENAECRELSAADAQRGVDNITAVPEPLS